MSLRSDCRWNRRGRRSEPARATRGRRVPRRPQRARGDRDGRLVTVALSCRPRGAGDSERRHHGDAQLVGELATAPITYGAVEWLRREHRRAAWLRANPRRGLPRGARRAARPARAASRSSATGCASEAATPSRAGELRLQRTRTTRAYPRGRRRPRGGRVVAPRRAARATLVRAARPVVLAFPGQGSLTRASARRGATTRASRWSRLGERRAASTSCALVLDGPRHDARRDRERPARDLRPVARGPRRDRAREARRRSRSATASASTPRSWPPASSRATRARGSSPPAGRRCATPPRPPPAGWSPCSAGTRRSPRPPATTVDGRVDREPQRTGAGRRSAATPTALETLARAVPRSSASAGRSRSRSAVRSTPRSWRPRRPRSRPPSRPRASTGRDAVVANVDGEPHDDPADWPALLLRQLTEPVRFERACRRCPSGAVVVECGPGARAAGAHREDP